jgi:hypothetical protein
MFHMMPEEPTIGNERREFYNEKVALIRVYERSDSHPMLKRRVRYLLVFSALLSIVGTVSARQLIQGDNCRIAADETLVGTVFVFCQQLTIDGTLEGNLIGAATNTDIRGTVADGIYLLGGQLDLHGTVREDLHYIGVVLNLHEGSTFETDVADIFSLTMSTRLSAGTTLPGSIIAVGYQLISQGQVGGEISFWGVALELGGDVAGDVTADVGDANDTDGTAQLETLFIPLPVELSLVDPGLRVADEANIGGTLRYRSPTASTIPTDIVTGNTFFEDISQQPQIVNLSDEDTVRRAVGRYLMDGLREFATLAVVGALGLVFAPGLTQSPIRNLRQRPLTSLGVGTLAFLLSFPIVVIALVVSLLVIFALSLVQVGNLTIAALVVLLLLDVGGASLFYFVAIFVARSVVCLAFGRWLIHWLFIDDGTMRYLYLSLVVGSLVVALVVSLPFVGWLLNALTLFLGLGAIVNLVQAQLRSIRENDLYETTSAQPSPTRFGSRRWLGVERPMLPDAPPASYKSQTKPRPRHNVGTTNLPDGFVWWDEL